MPLPVAEMRGLLSEYPATPVVATVGSHSALDIADGAASEGLATLVLAQAGRDATYTKYFRSTHGPPGFPRRGCVDEVWTYPKFAELAAPAVQERLRRKGAVLVPNRAFSSYLPLSAIEDEFRVPIVGSRSLLRIEERTERENYYTLLQKAGIPTPTRLRRPGSRDPTRSTVSRS